MTAVPVLVALLLASNAAAQDRPAGELPPRPQSASPAAVGGWCDALTGDKKAECLRDERRQQERGEREPAARGACDALLGPEKDRCLRQGGTVGVGTEASAGGTRANEH